MVGRGKTLNAQRHSFTYEIIRNLNVRSHSNFIDFGVLRSGFNDFKTVWHFRWERLLLLRVLMLYFETIHSVHTCLKKPAPNSKKFF